jgi:hypothetical protein
MPIKKEVKPGYKTTEFYAGIATSLCGVLTTMGLLRGCASNTIQTPLIGPNGQVVLDKDGKPLMLTQSLTDSAMFTRDQAKAAEQAKPIAQLSFPNGGTLPAGTSFVVWGNNGAPVVRQYEEPWIQAIRETKGLLYMATLGWLLGPMNSNSGSTTTTINGGAQSPIAVNSRQNSAVAVGGAGAGTDAGGAGGAGGPATATVTNSPTETKTASSQNNIGKLF